MGAAVVHCDYDGFDAIDINEAILTHNVVEVFGSDIGGTPYCSISESIVGRRDVRVDFNGAYVEAQADVPVVKLINGFTLENATILTGDVVDYEGPAITYEGDHNSTYPTTVRDVVVRGSAANKTGVGVAMIADSDGPTRKVTHTYFKGVHIHNYAVGLLLRDVHAESDLDWLNANYYQGRISGSLRAIELEHANGNHIIVDFQPSPDALSGLRCFACGNNRISGMFWDSQQVAEKVLQLDADSLRNHIETPLRSTYIQDDGVENVIH